MQKFHDLRFTKPNCFPDDLKKGFALCKCVRLKLSTDLKYPQFKRMSVIYYNALFALFSWVGRGTCMNTLLDGAKCESFHQCAYASWHNGTNPHRSVCTGSAITMSRPQTRFKRIKVLFVASHSIVDLRYCIWLNMQNSHSWF